MVYLPQESWGICEVCGAAGYLGDGLCQRCWDGPEDRIEQWRLARSRNVFIMQLSADGVRVNDIAKRYGLDPKTVRKIRWKYA